MAFGVSISGKKPVATVTVGSVTIPIYAAPVTVKVTKPIDATDAKIGGGTETRTYQSFQLSHFEGARRVLQRRNTLERAKALAKEVATRLSRDGSRAAFLSEKDRRILILAQLVVKPSGKEVDEVCRMFMELQKQVKNGTLQQAVDFFNTHGQRLRHGATVKDIFPEYIMAVVKLWGASCPLSRGAFAFN